VHELTEKLREILRGEHSTRFVVILGAIGAALILLSGFSPEKHADTHNTDTPAASFSTEPDAYRQQLEDRLTDLLSQMEGVGEVTVMVTVGGSSAQIYAEEVKAARSSNSQQTESSPVLTRNGSTESPLIAETRYPAVCGAVILCTGGGHAVIQERIKQAASTLLGIPAAKIYVGKAGSNN